jgi:glycosyltransferase involved in cell wall biosynthesis
MRILQVSSHYPPYHMGGAERCCAALSSALRAAGHEVLVAAPVPAGTYDGVRASGLPRRRAPMPLRKLALDYVNPAASRALRRTIAAFRPDVVHFHNVYGIGSWLVADTARTVPAVLTLHDYWPVDLVAPSYIDGTLRYPPRARALAPMLAVHRALHGRALRDATLIAPSRFLAGRVGRALSRVVGVVPNGVDAMDGVAGPRSNRILFVGRIVREKGIGLVLPALTRIAAEAGWRVDVVGDGPLRPTLQARFPDLEWHGSTDPGPLYREASILVVPSIWPENAPCVVLEGMAHGVAVLAAAAGGVPELVRHGETGLLHRPGDVASFAASLRELLADPARRDALGTAARAATRDLTWSAVSEQYLRVYERALGRCGAPHVADARMADIAA